jgi:glutathione S-transferase
MAFYEAGVPFVSRFTDLGKEEDRNRLYALSPLGKFPLLVDKVASEVIPESTIIIEYLAQRFPKAAGLIPPDPRQALAVRAQDRFFDLYVHKQMQALISDRLRPADERDAYGVEQTLGVLRKSYAILERELEGRTWAVGETLTMADCAAAPALFYANKVCPLEGKNLTAYHDRLVARPSYARVLAEAEPYFHMFPG